MQNWAEDIPSSLSYEYNNRQWFPPAFLAPYAKSITLSDCVLCVTSTSTLLLRGLANVLLRELVTECRRSLSPEYTKSVAEMYATKQMEATTRYTTVIL
jgi:hypothetical protein